MSDSSLTRRAVLKAGAAAGAVVAMGAVMPAAAQTPRRGGVFRLTVADPPHFDPHLTVSWSTHIALSFTHSQLLKHRAGPTVTPGTFPIEGDLAESWAQTNETTYVFKLRRGVRWHPKVPFETSASGSDWMDSVQIYLRNWKTAGIDAELRIKEPGAFTSNAMLGRFDRMMLGMRGGILFPDPYLASMHLPGERPNSSGVNDPKLTEMIRVQRRTLDAAKRRDVIWDIQRYLAEQVYYFSGPSARVVAAWEPHVRNFAPNLGNDYGGRLMAAWLAR